MRALIFALCLLTSPALADVVGVASVINGDTIEVHGQRIRLHGIDAPIHAAMRADAMLEKGDMDGYAVWKRILRTVEESQGAKPSGSRSPHQKRTPEDGCNCPAKRTKSILRDLRNGATATRDRGVRAAPRRRS